MDNKTKTLSKGDDTSLLLVELSHLCLRKSKAYGPQKELIKSIFDKILSKPLEIKNGDDAWRFHLLMEVVAKLTRALNLYTNEDKKGFESLVDSLKDGSVYNAMLATELEDNQ